MTAAAGSQCSEAEARDLTDRLRVAMSDVARLCIDARLPRSAKKQSAVVYFIQTGIYSDDPVKIGVADSVKARMAQLQTGSPYELRLLGSMPGDVAVERELHQRFAHLHLRGEWFEGSDELLTAIAEMTR